MTNKLGVDLVFNKVKHISGTKHQIIGLIFSQKKKRRKAQTHEEHLLLHPMNEVDALDFLYQSMTTKLSPLYLMYFYIITSNTHGLRPSPHMPSGFARLLAHCLMSELPCR